MHYFLSRKKSTGFRSWPEQTWVDPGGFHSNSPLSEPGSPATVSNHNVLPDLCARQWTCLLLHFSLLGVRRQFQDHIQYLPINYLVIRPAYSYFYHHDDSSHWLNVISVHKIAYFVFLKNTIWKCSYGQKHHFHWSGQYLAVFPVLQSHRTHWGTSCHQRFAHRTLAGRIATDRRRIHQPAGHRPHYLGQPPELWNLPDVQ